MLPPNKEDQTNGRHKSEAPDPEVVPKAKRRQFSASYKLSIVGEADACTEAGQIGSMLRREGLYSSHLSTWRKQRNQGQLKGLSRKKQGRKQADQRDEELKELRRENERLRQRLEQAEAIIDVQKKLSELLGLTREKDGSA